MEISVKRGRRARAASSSSQGFASVNESACRYGSRLVLLRYRSSAWLLCRTSIVKATLIEASRARPPLPRLESRERANRPSRALFSFDLRPSLDATSALTLERRFALYDRHIHLSSSAKRYVGSIIRSRGETIVETSSRDREEEESENSVEGKKRGGNWTSERGESRTWIRGWWTRAKGAIN